ncbi:hypothetical protein Bbelb_031100 [Branchiostoma belcheri]|nr:hypothetical protein Bbelb_031100 [Branchiostoma belcheri]
MNLRRCFRVIFCPGFGSELRALTKLAWPTTVAFVLEYVMWMMPILFCGHLGKIQLDAVTLAISVVNVTGISLGIGLLTACDTLMAQTFGSDNKMRVGVILQRSILILLLSCFPLLEFVHEHREAAAADSSGSRSCQNTLKRFAADYTDASSPGIVYPAMFINLFVNILNVPANYLCILYFGWGVRGAAIATGVTQYLLCLFMFLYIRVRKLHLQTWPGWRSDCLQEWGVYVKLAIAGLLMECLESLTFEIGTLLTGLIGTVNLAAQGIIMTINSLNYMIPFAMGIAASIRVGNELGAGNAAQTKLAAKVSIFSFCCYAFVASIVLVSSRHVLGSVFTNNKEVVRLIGEVLPIVGVTQLADSVQAGCAGILRGCGKQKLGAIITFAGYYVLGLPFIAIFMFKLHLGVKGLYFGLGIATMFQCVSFLITIARTDWVQEARKAQDRAGVRAEEDASHCNGRTAKELGREDRFPNGSLGRAGAQEMQSVAATLEDSTYSQHSLAHKYTEQETEFTTMPPLNRELSEMQEADTQHFLQETGSTDTEPLLDSLTSEVSDTSEVMVLSLEKLPFKVMVYRRLVAVAACLAILTVGVVVREFVPNPHFSYPPDCVTWTTVNGSLPLNTTLPWCNTTVTNMSSSEVTTLHHFSAGHRVQLEQTTTTTTTVTAKAGTILDSVVFSTKDRFAYVWKVFSTKDRFTCVWKVFSTKDRFACVWKVFSTKHRFACGWKVFSTKYRLICVWKVFSTKDRFAYVWKVFSIKDRFAYVWKVFSTKDRFAYVWKVFSTKDRFAYVWKVFSTKDRFAYVWKVFSTKDRFTCVWEVFSTKVRFACEWEVFSTKGRFAYVWKVFSIKDRFAYVWKVFSTKDRFAYVWKVFSTKDRFAYVWKVFSTKDRFAYVWKVFSTKERFAYVWKVFSTKDRFACVGKMFILPRNDTRK